jgi:predicted small metal-binding protein
MAQQSVDCPVCGGTLSAESEDALVQNLQKHAKENHNREMNDQQAKDIIGKQTGE